MLFLFMSYGTTCPFTKQKQSKPTIRMSSVNQDMSLFIPRVFLNITADRIKNCVQDFGLGEVERVDLALKGNYNAAYVHFKRWNNNSFTSRFQERASDPSQKCFLEYDAPWYWIVLENTSAKRVGPERRKEVVNLRPNFMEPLPIARGLSDELNISAIPASDKTVPYSVLEDLMWDMEQMQGTINELRSELEQYGFQIPETERQEVDPQPEPDTVVDELNMEIQNMQYEIEDLKNAIFGQEKIVTCAVTGNKFREVLKVVYEPLEEVEPELKNGLTRDVATCVDDSCQLKRTESYNIDADFWEEWEPVEVESEEFSGMCNQMFKNKITGVISDLGDLLELGLSKRANQIEVEF